MDSAITPPGRRSVRQINAFTVDVEDYFHVAALSSAISRDSWGSRELRVEAQHRTAARNTGRARRARDVLRARLARRARARRWCAASPMPVTRSPVTATRTSWSTRRRRASSAKRRCAPRASSRTRSGTRVLGYRAASFSVTATVAVGTRCADRSRLPLRLLDLPDPPRSVRHTRGDPRAAPGERPLGAHAGGISDVGGEVSSACRCRSPAAATSASCPTG